jgi:hypothetical protein
MCTRRYQIIISGRLGTVGREAFRDFHIEPHGPDTALTRTRDLALDLVGFTCLAPEPDTRHRSAPPLAAHH